MNLLFIQENIVQALCRTFVHSLWQGLLAAAVAGLVILATKRSKAAIRYNLLAFLFSCFIATTFITFLLQPGILSDSPFQTTVIRFVPNADDNTIVLKQAEDKWQFALTRENYYQYIIQFSDRYASVITGVWMLCFCFHILKMFVSLHYARRIRSYQTWAVTGAWKQRLSKMTQLVGIRQSVSLMESGIIKVPVVTGFLKPMILIPAGMLANLSVEQVESILLHELAHVRRKDFLINFLQRFAESLFFFNPFIMWLSARIREEREACCDDIVLKNTADKRPYLEALISFREASMRPGSYAISLGGNNKLLYRVKRMITQENKKLNAMEKLTLILILTAGTAVSFMPAERVQHKQNDKNGQQSVSVPQKEAPPVSSVIQSNGLTASTGKDTLPGKEIITFKNISSVNNDDGETRSSAVTTKGSNGKTYSYRIENGNITDLAIDGVKIKKEDFHRYKPIVDQIEIVREERGDNTFLRQQLAAADLMNQQTSLNQKLMELQSKENNNILNEQQELLEKKMLMENDNNTLFIDQEKKKMFLADMLTKQQERDVISKKLALSDSYNQELMHQQLMLEKIKLQRHDDLLLKQDLQLNNGSDQLPSILAELISADVIKNKSNFSFSLDNNQLIVDGKKQAAPLFDSMRKKYIRHKNDYYKYKINGNSKSTDIYVE